MLQCRFHKFLRTEQGLITPLLAEESARATPGAMDGSDPERAANLFSPDGRMRCAIINARAPRADPVVAVAAASPRVTLEGAGTDLAARGASPRHPSYFACTHSQHTTGCGRRRRASSLSSLHPDLILSCRGLVTDPLFALEIVKDSAMMQQQRSPSYSACSVRFDGDGGVGLFFYYFFFYKWHVCNRNP